MAIEKSTAAGAALLDLDGGCRSFEGVTALEPLSLSLVSGEILGLVGENGAGKSTLIRLISGVIRPAAGSFIWRGRPVRLDSPRDAIDLGIATIHQELEYCGHQTVAENQALEAEARRRLLDSGFDVPVDCEFSRLTAVEKQEVAIATALAREAGLLVLDEPTASLAAPDVRRLIDHLKRVQATGVTILYVSHRLDEVLDLSTRVAVLRDGALVRVSPIDELDGQALVCDMVGRPLQQVFPRTRSGDTGELLLRVAGLTRAGLFEDVSLEIRAGEVVGLAGLVGAGRSELARAIYGLYGVDGGTMQLLGKPWAPSSPRQALEAGLVYVPEERKRHGLVGDHDLSSTLAVGPTT